MIGDAEDFLIEIELVLRKLGNRDIEECRKKFMDIFTKKSLK